MNNTFAIQLLLIALFAVANLPVLFHLINQRRIQVLDFTKLVAVASDISADASALQAQAAASNDVAHQAAIDAVAETLGSAGSVLKGLLPTPPAPVADPVIQ